MEELKRHLKLTLKETENIVNTVRQIEDGKVTLPNRDMAVLSLLSAHYMSTELARAIDEEDFAQAMAHAVAGQRLISNAAGCCLSIELGRSMDDRRSVMSQLGKAGAAAMLAQSEKQAAKAVVRECWDEWQAKPYRYSTVAEFARDMLRNNKSLDSQPVIERWCRAWAKETQPPK